MSDAAPAVERWLAWRYLATRQREGFVSFIAIFSLIGVALGVATLIVVLSVMGGFRQQLLGRIIGMNGHIVITAGTGMVQATPELLAKLKDFPGVRAVRLTLERQALVAANGQTRGASLRGASGTLTTPIALGNSPGTAAAPRRRRSAGPPIRRHRGDRRRRRQDGRGAWIGPQDAGRGSTRRG